MAGSDDLKELSLRWRMLKDLVTREMAAFDEALTAALQEGASSQAGAPPPESTTADPAPTPQTPPATPEPSPYDPPHEMNLHDWVLYVVGNVSELDEGAMAERALGENTAATRKVISNILGHLQRSGKIVNVRKGVWRLRKPGERKRRS